MIAKGIIAEFDPFHNGHKYIIDRMMNEDSVIISAISSNYVQRGMPAFFSKFTRANAALLSGVDIVAEIPSVWSCSPAYNFAMGGVSLLKNLLCQQIFFGCECDDIDKLKKLARFEDNFKFNYSSPYGYAYQRSAAVKDVFDEEYCNIIKGANNSLAIEYMRAAGRLNYECELKPVERFRVNHNDSDVCETIASASKIREMLTENEDAGIFLPAESGNVFKTKINNGEYIDYNKFSASITSYLRRFDSFGFLPDISEGLQNRILKSVKCSGNYYNMIENIKSKRYPTARIRRLLISAYLEFDGFWLNKSVPYIKILGFTKKGEEYLKTIAKKITIPLIICNKPNKPLDNTSQMLLNKECIRNDIYDSLLVNPLPCGSDYTTKIIKTG